MMTNGMWWMASAVLLILQIIGVIVANLWLKENLPLLAENDKWFTTVKKGKIKLVKIAGKIVGYYGNLSDQNKCVERMTGKVILKTDMTGSDKKEDFEKSYLWRKFGVIWIGFGGSIYKYPFEKMDKVDGKIVSVKTSATSIFLKNTFIVLVDDAETKEMVQIKLIAQLTTETKNAGLSLNYSNWIGVIEEKVRSACRDFIATKGLREITGQQLENGGELYTYVTKSLKNNNAGNPSLEVELGQEIVGFSVISLEITEKNVKDAVQSSEISEELNKSKIKNAEGDALARQIAVESDVKAMDKTATAKLEASKKEAAGIKFIGAAQNEVLEKTASIITPKGAEELEKTRAIASAIEKHEGTLVLGGGNGILLGDSGERK